MVFHYNYEKTLSMPSIYPICISHDHYETYNLKSRNLMYKLMHANKQTIVGHIDDMFYDVQILQLLKQSDL